MDAMTGTGERLLADVQGRRIPEDALGLWWLGQASFIVRGAGVTLYVDPYLNPSPRRIVPPPFRPEQVTNADVVLCTHDHGDHIDPTALPGIGGASPRATLWPCQAKPFSLKLRSPRRRECTSNRRVLPCALLSP